MNCREKAESPASKWKIDTTGSPALQAVLVRDCVERWRGGRVCVCVWLNTQRYTVCWGALKKRRREEKEDGLMRIVAAGCRKFVIDV